MTSKWKNNLPQFILVLLFTLLPSQGQSLYAQRQASPERCKSIYARDTWQQRPTKALSAEYKRLKNNRECAKYNSDLQRLMETLAQRMKEKRSPHLLKYMGKPDATELPEGYRGVYPLKPNQQIFIYHWRSWHDWVYFVVENKKIIHADWFYAYE